MCAALSMHRLFYELSHNSAIRAQPLNHFMPISIFEGVQTKQV
jgi:hypothetical protein